jgi:acyl carrier protein
MTHDEIQERVVTIIKQETKHDLSKVNPAQDLRTQVNLDSMQMVEIYAAIVEEFGIQVPISIVGALTLDGIVGALKNELTPKAS